MSPVRNLVTEQMTRDEVISVADYIHELYDRVRDAEVEVRTLETELEKAHEDCGYTELALEAALNECATLEAENVRLVERVAELKQRLYGSYNHMP